MKQNAFGIFAVAGIIALSVHPAFAAVVTFESFTVPSEGFWNGSDLSGTPGPAGGFGEIPRVQEKEIEGTFFRNTYTELFGSWSGFAISNRTNTTSPDLSNQYSAFAGSGAGLSANYAVGFYATYEASTHVKLGSLTNLAGKGASFTNTTYTALDMLNGSGFGKKFGGLSGNDPDYLVLTIQGFAGGIPTANPSIDFYLADYRFADNGLDYVIEDWTFVDFSVLGTVDELRFTMSSSDNSDYGSGPSMNTPSFFAVDNFLAVPEPSSLMAAIGGLGLFLRRKR
jgi:Domain of unknown function (DUF4465)